MESSESPSIWEWLQKQKDLVDFETVGAASAVATSGIIGVSHASKKDVDGVKGDLKEFTSNVMGRTDRLDDSIKGDIKESKTDITQRMKVASRRMERLEDRFGRLEDNVSKLASKEDLNEVKEGFKEYNKENQQRFDKLEGKIDQANTDLQGSIVGVHTALNRWGFVFLFVLAVASSWGLWSSRNARHAGGKSVAGLAGPQADGRT